jgi:hypothetical protein
MADGANLPQAVDGAGEKPESRVADGFDAENGRPRTGEFDAVADGEIERQLVRKLDCNLVPLVMAICERFVRLCTKS